MTVTRRPHLIGLVGLALICAPVALSTGCGDEKPEEGGKGRGVSTGVKSHGNAAARKKAAAAGKAAGGADEIAVPERFKNANWASAQDLTVTLREERDPFSQYVDDLVKKPDVVESGEQQRQTGSIIDSEVPELKLMAIITGTAVAKAMVTDSRGLGHVVRVGDVVGDKVPMRVARITRNEVLFQPLQATVDEQPVEEVRKVLLTQEELEELRP